MRRLPAALGVLLLALAISITANADAGKRAYKKANCVGCHKWHGGGGGGYGGVALSLRTSQLDRDGLRLVVRCGRPGTRMPYHWRKAYRGESRECFDTTATELGDNAPPRARQFLREQEIDSLIEYIQQHIQGKGSPDYGDCVAFWGANARRCEAMKAATTEEG